MHINQAIFFINKLVDTHPERHYVEAIECIEKELAEALKPSHNSRVTFARSGHIARLRRNTAYVGCNKSRSYRKLNNGI